MSDFGSRMGADLGSRRLPVAQRRVPSTEVARRAGHSVAVLFKVYAHCIDGQTDTVKERIASALGGDEEIA